MTSTPFTSAPSTRAEEKLRRREARLRAEEAHAVHAHAQRYARRSATITVRDEYQLVKDVALYFRCRSSEPDKENQRMPLTVALNHLDAHPGDEVGACAILFRQLAADVQHSALLLQLFRGEDLTYPISYKREPISSQEKT